MYKMNTLIIFTRKLILSSRIFEYLFNSQEISLFLGFIGMGIGAQALKSSGSSFERQFRSPPRCVCLLVVYIHGNEPSDLVIIVVSNLGCSFLWRKGKLKTSEVT